MDIPIIIVHKTDRDYLQYALRAAKKHNKDVTLITDIKSDKYKALVKVVDIDDYKNEGSEQFSKIYRHLSTNTHSFEFNAIKKFFFILEHMKRYHLEKILYIDSDVIIHEDLTKIINQYYTSYDLCSCQPAKQEEDFLWTASAHVFLCTYNALELFCSFILNTYVHNIPTLNLKWQWHQKNNLPGGICDMTLLYLFQKETDLKIGSFLNVMDDSFCFDLTIKSSMNEYENEYEMRYSFLLGYDIKKLIFKNNYPYGYNRILKKEIRFCISHCQSDAKRIMQTLVKDQKNIGEYISDSLQTLKILYSAVRRTLSKRFR